MATDFRHRRGRSGATKKLHVAPRCRYAEHMNEPIIVAAELMPPIAPDAADVSAQPSSAALRAEVAVLLERDLYRRFERAGPRERVLIEIVAVLAADLAHLCKMFGPDCDARVLPLLLGGINRVSRGLCLLGTEHIAGTFAERILTDAI